MIDKAKLEFVAKITMPDVTVIERTVEGSDGIPALDDFHVDTKEGFLESFDACEKVSLEARNKIGTEIMQEYMAEVSKKRGKGHRRPPLRGGSGNRMHPDRKSTPFFLNFKTEGMSVELFPDTDFACIL